MFHSLYHHAQMKSTHTDKLQVAESLIWQMQPPTIAGWSMILLIQIRAYLKRMNGYIRPAASLGGCYCLLLLFWSQQERYPWVQSVVKNSETILSHLHVYGYILNSFCFFNWSFTSYWLISSPHVYFAHLAPAVWAIWHSHTHHKKKVSINVCA